MNRKIQFESVLLFGIILCWAILSTSCVKKEYDVRGKLDTTMSIGGDSLSIPLGKTDTIFARTLLGDIQDGEFLKVLADGSYAVQQGNHTALDVPEVNKNEVTVAEIIGDTLVDIIFEPELSAKAAVFKSPFISAVRAKISLDGLSDDIKRIDSLSLLNSTIDFDFVLGGMLTNSLDAVTITADIDVEFPDQIILAPDSRVGPNGTLKVQGEVVNGKISVSAGIKAFNMSSMPVSNGVVEINEMIQCKGTLTLRVNDATKIDTNSPINGELGISYTLDNSEPSVFYGQLDPNLEPQITSVAMEGVPEILKDPNSVFDFANPHLLIVANSNVGVALDAEVSISPYVNGQEMTESSEIINLSLPARYDGQLKSTYFWAAETSAQMPVGYTFVKTDLSKLLSKIPDSLQLKTNISSNLSTPHLYNFNVGYKADIDYKIEIPMSFGPDLHLVLGDTLGNIPEIISTILNGNELIFAGEIFNTLPLDLKLKLKLLDSLNVEIPIESTVQNVASGTAKGGELMSKLEIKLSDRTGLLAKTKIASIYLNFVGTTGAETQGVPIYEHSYVRAVLRAKVPGGITIKLEDILNEK